MAFVYEMVGKKNREVWDSIGWKNWANKQIEFLESRHWSIDKDNGIYMLPIGGFIDMPDYYDLAFKGRIVRMEVFCKTEGNRVDGGAFIWKINKMYVPKSIWNEREQVMQEVINAFSVVNNGLLIEKTKGITVEIQCQPECVEVDYNGK